MIEYRNVKKVYNDKVVIENLNLTINQGEFFMPYRTIGLWKDNNIEDVESDYQT
ncbi:hypothetical protein [Erysipelothrix piscisicarius]|uniref:hypothetical protein n=1 Tax=Erysipelothrix piscisicarius TaxID=2485784 RepID=UPI002F935DEB